MVHVLILAGAALATGLETRATSMHRAHLEADQSNLEAVANNSVVSLTSLGSGVLTNGAHSSLSGAQDQHRTGLDLAAELNTTEDVARLLGDMASSLLTDDGLASVTEYVRSLAPRMALDRAIGAVEAAHSLPPDVATLLSLESTDPGNMSQAALERGRKVLNGLVEKAWKEMDDKIVTCKEFEEENRDTVSQVSSDISRMVEEITDLERLGTEALEGMSSKDQTISSLTTELESEQRIFGQLEASNAADLKVVRDDLEVFRFVMEFTRCDNERPARAAASALLDTSTSHSTGAQICQTSDGERDVVFDDAELQLRYQNLTRDSSSKALSSLLENFVAIGQPQKAAVIGEHGRPCDVVGDPAACMKSCSPMPPDCGLLHDKLSLLWGDYKDKADQLVYQMGKDHTKLHELQTSINEQLHVATAAKARYSMQISEVRANLATVREEKKQKEGEKLELDGKYSEMVRACKKRISWILHQDMCSLIVVRNALMTHSSTCPPETISDCDVDKWVPNECSLSCDDQCPNKIDPYACGGWQELSRSIVVAPNQCGLKCPKLQRHRKCNQIQCPVDCAVSEWSGWSRCTAECEGGVQARTRSVLVKPLHGGQACNTVSESRACNTGSCDRDCTLTKWSPWTPCSVGCGGGFRERRRHVLVPTRGFGKCPTPTAASRFGKQLCNQHDCAGDELCISKQDLIVAIDGSGSLSPKGFDALRGFAVKLLQRYRGEYFGATAAKVGVILFGNGRIMADGQTVSPALNAQPLTSDPQRAIKAVSGLPFVKGFTNMAQAFALAETMFTVGGRKEAQSALLVITDGRPSFMFQTESVVHQLEDRHVHRYFVVVNGQGELDVMKRWASPPWETNLVHVPGVDALQADHELWVQKSLALFCPLSFSPKQQHALEAVAGFIRVKTGGFCGERGQQLSSDVRTPTECANLAKKIGASAFLFGKSFREGHCFSSSLRVDSELFHRWDDNRVDPACPDGWKESTMLDFFVLEPESVAQETLLRDSAHADAMSAAAQGYSLW